MLEQEIKKLIELLVDLDKKTKELDGHLQEIRIAIDKDLWDLIRLSNIKTLKSNKRIKDVKP